MQLNNLLGYHCPAGPSGEYIPHLISSWAGSIQQLPRACMLSYIAQIIIYLEYRRKVGSRRAEIATVENVCWTIPCVALGCKYISACMQWTSLPRVHKRYLSCMCSYHYTVDFTHYALIYLPL